MRLECRGRGGVAREARATAAGAPAALRGVPGDAAGRGNTRMQQKHRIGVRADACRSRQARGPLTIWVSTPRRASCNASSSNPGATPAASHPRTCSRSRCSFFRSRFSCSDTLDRSRASPGPCRAGGVGVSVETGAGSAAASAQASAARLQGFQFVEQLLPFGHALGAFLQHHLHLLLQPPGSRHGGGRAAHGGAT
jgi:hypothetical protein